eukprot:3466343-Rhodomonas_salina.1
MKSNAVTDPGVPDGISGQTRAFRTASVPCCSILHPPSSILHPPSSILHPHCSTLDAQCSMLNAQCPMLNAQCSMLSAQCSVASPRLTSGVVRSGWRRERRVPPLLLACAASVPCSVQHTRNVFAAVFQFVLLRLRRDAARLRGVCWAESSARATAGGWMCAGEEGRLLSSTPARSVLCASVFGGSASVSRCKAGVSGRMPLFAQQKQACFSAFVLVQVRLSLPCPVRDCGASGFSCWRDGPTTSGKRRLTAWCVCVNCRTRHTKRIMTPDASWPTPHLAAPPLSMLQRHAHRF